MSSSDNFDSTFPNSDEINFYRLYRELIVNEDTLISHRMSWFLGTQTMLFILWTSLAKAALSSFLASGVCLFGMLFCIPTFMGVWAAQLARKDIFYQYHKNLLPRKHHPRLPEMSEKRNYHYIGKSTPHLLNLLCFCGWSLVLRLWS